MTARPDEPLELVSFPIEDVSLGGPQRLAGGVLHVDGDALARLAEGEQALAGVEVDVVRPGDSVRLVNVMDVVEPAVKADDPETTFPGALGRLRPAGTGRTHRLAGCAVAALCDVPVREGYPDSVVDMAGPGARCSAWSETTNVVLRLRAEPDAPASAVERSARRVLLGAARQLASVSLGCPDGSLERLELAPAPPELPRVCAIVMIASEGPFEDTYLYGAPARGLVPTLLDPRELLDGALVSASYDHAGVRNPTFFYQRSALVRELVAAHGNRLAFAGVVLALGYLNGGFEKERSAVLAAKLARQAGADGVVVTTFASGNSQTDTMLIVQACERLGIRTTAILAETDDGLTDHVPEADSIVSVGNELEIVPAWAPERVIGGDALADGRPADDPGPLATVAYLGSTCQLGDLRLTAAAT